MYIANQFGSVLLSKHSHCCTRACLMDWEKRERGMGRQRREGWRDEGKRDGEIEKGGIGKGEIERGGIGRGCIGRGGIWRGGIGRGGSGEETFQK